MLTLPIKAKWYDMILSGEKKEEYRSCSKYWAKRFHNLGLLTTNEHALIKFRNGYSAASRSFVAEVRLSIGYGKPQWGAAAGEKYFILTIIKIIKRKDVTICE